MSIKSAIMTGLLTTGLLAGAAGAAFASGDSPTGGPTPNIPPVGAGGDRPPYNNVGNGGRTNVVPPGYIVTPPGYYVTPGY